MRRRTTTEPARLAGLLLLAATSSALAQGLLDVRIDAIDPSRFPELDVSATVVDEAGWTLRNLTERHLAIWEDDELLRLESVLLDKDPVSVVLALDSSGTMIPAADQLRRAAANILRIMDSRDAAAVLEFSSEPRFLVRFGENRAKAIRALSALVPYGPTALYDAAYRSLLELSSRSGKRNVVIISDGKDQNKADSGPGSRHTRDEVLALAKRLSIPIHAIAIGPRALKKELAYMARETGGRAYWAPRPVHLEELYRRIGAHLKGRIRLRTRTRHARLDATRRQLVLRVRAGTSYGEAKASYAAPGRWVVDVGPVGFRDGKPVDLASRAVTVRDQDLAQLAPGDPEGLVAFLQEPFGITAGLPAPAATPPVGDGDLLLEGVPLEVPLDDVDLGP